MYQNSFWDTVTGQQLADVLIKYLPTVAKNESVAKNATVSKQTKQYAMFTPCFGAEVINKELEAGAKIIYVTLCPGDYLFIVFERDDSNG